MLKEFIEHIQKTTQPLITNVNGSTFCVISVPPVGYIRSSAATPSAC